MRIISFCADGIRQAANRGFYSWVKDQDADFICVQDLRAQENQLQDDIFHPAGYYAYFFDAPLPATNGVAIYVREIPKAIMTGLGFMEADMEARYIQADYERISIGCLLAPQSVAGDEASQAHKRRFFEHYQLHLNKIRHKRREYIICGSWFVAHRADDVESADEHTADPGFLPEERQWLNALYRDLDYADAFRRVNSDSDEFSWWPGGSRETHGWRTDTQVVSGGISQKVEYGAIFKTQQFSSHAPVIMDYDLEL
jgi:exodeoxyribonuclease-3